MNKKDKKIFILIEDYREPGSAVAYGVNLAKKLNLPALLVAVGKAPQPPMPTAVPGSDVPHPYALTEEDIKKRMIPHIHKIWLDMTRIWEQVHYDTAIGFPESEVLSLTDKRSPFLLVMEGQSNLTTINQWLGTFETRIAERTDCPVLIVQPELRWQPISKILYLMDANDSKIDNMRVLGSLVKNLHAHLQVLLISEKHSYLRENNFRNMIEVFQNLLGYREATFHRVFGEKKADQVTALVKETAPDWLAFEQKNKNFFERILNDYHTKRLILQSEIPVLVF